MIVPFTSSGRGINMSPYLAIPVVPAVCAIVGDVNGVLAVKLNLNSFIVSPMGSPPSRPRLPPWEESTKAAGPGKFRG